MNKINPAILKNLNSSLMGRLKLNLFKEITGRENVVPTTDKSLSYIKSIPQKNIIIAEIHSYILADARYSVVDFNELNKSIDIEQLFNNLNAYPFKQPMFYEVRGFYEDRPIGVWVNCCELAGDIGFFYEVAFLTDDHYPEEISYYEIRTSQIEPEPAFCYYNADGKWVSAKKDDPNIIRDPATFLCLQVLSFLADYHTEHFVSIDKIRDKKVDITHKGPAPEDPQYYALVKQLYKGEIPCHIAYIKFDQVIPFNFDACFMIPLYQIQDNLGLLDEFQRQGVVVYWKDNHFIMIDDYLTYMVLRISGVSEIKVVILGNEGVKNVQIRTSGGFNLLPALQTFKSPNVDLLSPDLRVLHLDEYISKIAATINLKSLIRAKCVVLSEDKDTYMLMTLLMANGFNSDEVTIMSYDNCTKIDLLPLTLETIRKINKDILFLIHRDRDYLDEKQIKNVRKKVKALGADAFITDGVDIETCFLNATHIHFLYPDLDIEKIEGWLDEANKLTRSLSIEKMMKHKYGEKYKEHLQEKEQFAAEYDQAPLFFRSGKETMRILKSIIHRYIDGNLNLIEQSPCLQVYDLQEIGSKLWPY